jgi:hypothetical protein
MAHVDHVQIPERQLGWSHSIAPMMTHGVKDKSSPETPTALSLRMNRFPRSPAFAGFNLVEFGGRHSTPTIARSASSGLAEN